MATAKKAPAKKTVAKKVATPVPNPETPVEIGNPVNAVPEDSTITRAS